jgi:hypothetical protein
MRDMLAKVCEALSEALRTDIPVAADDFLQEVTKIMVPNFGIAAVKSTKCTWQMEWIEPSCFFDKPCRRPRGCQTTIEKPIAESSPSRGLRYRDQGSILKETPTVQFGVSEVSAQG